MGTRQSRLRFNAAEGVEYRIQAFSWLQDPGAVRLRIQTGAAPRPATVVSLNLTPDSLSLENSGGSAHVASTLGVQAPDGLRKAVLTLTGPQGLFSTRFDLAGREPSSAPGDPTVRIYKDDNTFSTSLQGPGGGTPVVTGEWRTRLLLTDDYGETTAFGGPDDPPLPAGATTRLTVTGTEDVETPALTSATVTQGAVNVTASPAILTVEMAAADDQGVGEVSAFLRNPATGVTLASAGMNRVSGTQREGVWRGSLTVPAHAAPGDYQLTYFVSDLSRRGRGYAPDQGGAPLPAGAPEKVTVVNTGAFDATKPVLKKVTASVLRFSADAVPGSITIRVEAEDNQGIVGGSAGIHTDWNQGSGVLQRIPVPGAAEVWETSLNLSLNPNPGTGVRPGIYPVHCTLQDQAGNRILAGPGLWPPSEPPSSLPDLPVIIITPGAEDSYTVWRGKYPALAGPAGEFDADADQDGFINAVEFLCGTDPLLPSGPGKTDPRGERAPHLITSPSGPRLEFRYSAANLYGGRGTYWELKPSYLRPSRYAGWSQASGFIAGEPRRVAKDLVHAELPLDGPSGFMRLVLLTGSHSHWYFEP